MSASILFIFAKFNKQHHFITFAVMQQSILALAKQTIQLEAAAIQHLGELITPQLDTVIQLLHATTGRVVITGIGKSAIIAQKIVATFNSTGTPSIFLHAADALHGDVGMVQANDIVIIISKSGESPEIKALVPVVQNFKNTVIAIVGNTESYLATNANYVLNTTVSEEACPNNLAPTSSTTAQLVMGDVLAVCLMQLKGFTNIDFAKFHPGGNLGKRLYLTVANAMQPHAQPKVLLTATLKEVIVEITEKRVGVTAVVNHSNEVLGIITDGDLRRMLERTNHIGNITAADILTKYPKIIAVNELAVEALNLFKQYDITQLVVANNHQYVGILHINDLVREGII
jgi:arabinose-5-phosphate isomerase